QGATLVSTLLEGAADVDGDMLGVAITEVSKDGTLYFSTDVGKTWTAASNISEDHALLLEGNDLIYFQPTADINGELDALTFRVWDTTSPEGAGEYTDPTVLSGGSSPYSADSDTVK